MFSSTKYQLQNQLQRSPLVVVIFILLFKTVNMVMVIIVLLFLFLLGFLHTFFYIPPHKLFLWFESHFHLLTNKTTTTVLSDSITNKTTTTRKALVPKEEEEVEEKKKKKKKIKRESITTSDDLERVFATFDKNGDGFITKQELGEYLKNIGLFSSEKEVGNMVGKLDVNGDGLIDIDEFCDLYKSMWSKRSEHDFELNQDEDEDEVLIREAFDVFDGDRDGLISVKELGMVLKSMGLLNQGGGAKTEEECKEMIRQVDLDGDGMVSFDEFKLMMNKSGGRGLVQVPS